VFEYEYQLTRPAEDWLKGQGLETKREFPTPWGVCDLAGCSFNRDNVRLRLSHGQNKPVGTQLRVMILSLIPDIEKGRGITRESLQKKFRDLLDGSKIEREVGKLIEDKFVRVTKRGSFQKVNGWMPLHEKIVALELKLSRVKDVFYQAASHLEFADESYVGLPMETAKRLINSNRKDDFVNKGIGVLGITSNEARVLLNSNSTISKPNHILQAHCVERFWRTYPKDNLA